MHDHHRVKSFLNWYYKGLQTLSWVIMGVLVVPVTLQIFSRYTELIPRWIWTEEVARFCFIWMIIVGATLAVRDGSHFEVDVLPLPSNPKVEALLRLFVYVMMGILAGIFVWYGWGYAMFGYSQSSELTGINLIFIHGIYFVAGVSWIVFLMERILIVFAVLRGDKDAIKLLRGDFNVAR